MTVCGQEVRGTGGKPCKLDDGHRGTHSQDAWQCDACGRRRRGAPTRVVTNPHDGVVEVALCFMCVTVPGHDL